VSGPAFVQITNGETGGGTPETCTFPGANTLGNLIVVIAISFNGGNSNTFSAPTDTAGNTYHLAQFAPNNGTTDGSGVIYYAWNCKAAGAGNVVSISCSTDINGLEALEYSGVQNTLDPLDNANFATGAGGTTSVNLTTTVAGDLIVAGAYSDSGQTTAGSGYNLRGAQVNNTLIAEDGVFTGSGSVAVTSGPVDTVAWNIMAASFKAIVQAIPVPFWAAP